MNQKMKPPKYALKSKVGNTAYLKGLSTDDKPVYCLDKGSKIAFIQVDKEKFKEIENNEMNKNILEISAGINKSL